jgi:hypothetical protein
METVYVALVHTDSMDTYTWVYKNEPTRAQVIQRLYEWEQAEDLEWYEQTTSVHIYPEEVIG